MNRRQAISVAALLLSLIATSVPTHAQAPPGPREMAVRGVVSAFLQALTDKNAKALQGTTRLPVVLVYGADEGRPGQVVVVKSERLASQLTVVPPLPGGAALLADVASDLSVSFVGANAAVAVLHPRPKPSGPGIGCAALLGKPVGADWKVACLVVGSALGPVADQTEAVKQSIVGFWRALFNHDITQLRGFVNIPYMDIGQDKDGADIQAISEELLRQFGGAANVGAEEVATEFDANQLVSQMQPRFYGQSAAVVLYSSGVESFSKTPQECAFLVQGADGRWRIVATASG
jgi:hypothetical protein